MYSEYSKGWELRPELDKEFISLFDGWLGEDNLHKLDGVTGSDWTSFNTFIKLILENYGDYDALPKGFHK